MKRSVIVLIGIILAGTVISGVYLNIDQFDENNPHLTPEESIKIALQDPRVSSFIRNTQAYPTTVYKDGIWTVQFHAIGQQIFFIEVHVDDATGQIIDESNFAQNSNFLYAGINRENDYQYSDEKQGTSMVTSPGWDERIRYPYNDNPELIETAITYFTKLDFVQNFIKNNELEWGGYISKDNEIWLRGNDYSNYSIWMNVQLSYVSLEDNTHTISVIEVTSSNIFGNPNNSINQVIKIVESSDDFINYTKVMENYIRNIIFKWYNGSHPIYQGYYFNIHYSPEYYYIYDDREDIKDRSPVMLDRKTNNTGQTTDDPIDFYDSYNWIEIVISDESSNIVDIWGPDSALLTKGEILTIAHQNEKIVNWINEVGSYDNYTWYDGYGKWYVNFNGVVGYYSYAYITINDRTSEIIEVSTILSIPAKMSEMDINNLLLESSETKEFFKVVTNYETNLYYSHYGTWWVYYYDQDDNRNYFYGQVNDTDGTIIQISLFLVKPAELIENEVIKIIEGAGLKQFKNQYTDTITYVYYDGYAYYECTKINHDLQDETPCKWLYSVVPRIRRGNSFPGSKILEGVLIFNWS